MPAYSFLDTVATITGPGGTISLGAGAQVEEGGIDVERIEPDNQMTTGADGSGMHSLNAALSYKVVVRLLKTSPVNKQLSQMYQIQRASSANWGLNYISLKQNVLGDSFIGQQAAFSKFPKITYAKNPAMNEWSFDVIQGTLQLGSGIIANLATSLAGSV